MVKYSSEDPFSICGGSRPPEQRVDLGAGTATHRVPPKGSVRGETRVVQKLVWMVPVGEGRRDRQASPWQQSSRGRRRRTQQQRSPPVWHVDHCSTYCTSAHSLHQHLLHACTNLTLASISHLHLPHTHTCSTPAPTSHPHLFHTYTYLTPAPASPAPTSHLHLLYACTYFMLATSSHLSAAQIGRRQLE